MIFKPSKYYKDIYSIDYNKLKDEGITTLIFDLGDQIVTDIFAGNRFKIKTILVDSLGEKDMKITFLNRKIENCIVKKYGKRGAFARGKYYE